MVTGQIHPTIYTLTIHLFNWSLTQTSHGGSSRWPAEVQSEHQNEEDFTDFEDELVWVFQTLLICLDFPTKLLWKEGNSNSDFFCWPVLLLDVLAWLLIVVQLILEQTGALNISVTLYKVMEALCVMLLSGWKPTFTAGPSKPTGDPTEASLFSVC